MYSHKQLVNKHILNKGFTLVELSIVIVIIGLIVAGVVGGQTLVKQAKLRSVVTDIDKYKLATNAFKLEYDSLPGDIDNAESYFGAANTNNGDDGGHVDGATPEAFLYWQHMTLAQIISGNFTGAGNGGANNATPDINVPRSFDNENCFGIRDVGPSADGRIGNVSDRKPTKQSPMFIIGTERATTDCSNSGFAAKDVLNIDTKIDDGLSSTGAIMASEGADATNTLTSCDAHATGQYNLTLNDKQCVLLSIGVY